MLYRFFEILFAVALRIYFHPLEIKGMNRIPRGKPTIIVFNHNSAAIDSIVLSLLYKRQIYFLARGETFSGRFQNWFLRQINIIPIYRQEVFGGKQIKNREIYKTVYSLMAKNRVVLIAPEAISITVPRIREIKPGAVRMAIGAEMAHDFNLDIHILPVGINYGDSHSFRKSLLLNIGEPIRIKDYEHQIHQDKTNVITNLNQEIKSRLESLTLVIDREEDEKLALSMINHELQNRPNLSLYQKLTISQKIANNINQMHEAEKKRLGNYNKDAIKRISLINILFSIIGFPLFAIGLIVNAIPYFSTALVASGTTGRDDFLGTMKLVPGLFIFLGYYLILQICTALFIGWSSLLTIPVGLALGVIAWDYSQLVKLNTKEKKDLKTQAEVGKNSYSVIEESI